MTGVPPDVTGRWRAEEHLRQVQRMEALGRLAAGLETELRAAGWAVEPRAYRPHLTIARTDGVRAGPAAATVLERAAAGLDAGFTAGSVVLYRSHLGSGPARYEALREARLS